VPVHFGGDPARDQLMAAGLDFDRLLVRPRVLRELCRLSIGAALGMNVYRAMEIAILCFAMTLSLWMAVHRLMPAQVKQWRRRTMLWMVAEARSHRVRALGLRWARRSQAKTQASSCGGCKGCEAPTKS